MEDQAECWLHSSIMPGLWEKSHGLSVLGMVGSKGIKGTCLPLWCEWKHEAHTASSLEKSNKQPGLVDSWNSKWIGKCHNKPQIATEMAGHSFYPACLDIMFFLKQSEKYTILGIFKALGRPLRGYCFLPLATYVSFLTNPTLSLFFFL